MFPITRQQLESGLQRLAIPDILGATIRQISALCDLLEPMADAPMVHLEMGNPGLPPETIGTEAQIDALRSGVASKYPNIAGIPELKHNASRFLKAFFDIDVPASTIVPTVGSMQGSFTLQLLLSQRLPDRRGMLFISPGFPATRHQAKVLGIPNDGFDIYNYRGERLRKKLDEMLSTGRFSGMVYCNPNNPAWINLTPDELRIIGEMATKHDVIVLEDLAYLGMDFRTDVSRPFEPPYIPTVAKYTDNYIMMVSASKIFSYAGERVAAMCISPAVARRTYPFFASFYDMPAFIDAYTFGVLYTASSGVCHSAQHAFAKMLEKAVAGELPFVEHTREYQRRAARAKDIFLSNGFSLAYPNDLDTPISDGFFFTLAYPGMDSAGLQKELLRYGISTISLPSTGSEQQGVRVTVSMLSSDQTFNHLEERVCAFHNDHKTL